MIIRYLDPWGHCCDCGTVESRKFLGVKKASVGDSEIGELCELSFLRSPIPNLEIFWVLIV